MNAAYLVVPFIGGLVAMGLRLPPLIGFLAAGFALNLMGYRPTETLALLADLGVTLLLFTIGLKLNVRTLLRPQVWGAATLHAGLSTAVMIVPLALLKLAGVTLLTNAGWGAVLVVGFALSFSSTVFAVKVLEDRGEHTSLYGRIAIGVLIMQDIFAVVFITASTGKLPSPWAVLLLLLVPGSWLLRKVMSRVGHGEMLALFGVVAALVLGYALFEALGVKGDLGALVVGMLLAPHPASYELSRMLFTAKELLLVGFFINIGLTGLPTWETALVAIVLVAALPVKTALFLAVFTAFRMRWRTAFLSAAALASYSEFGLIVAVLATGNHWIDDDWLVTLSLTVAVSFVAAAVLNRFALDIYGRLDKRLPEQDPAKLIASDRPIFLGNTEAIVLGMGRVGKGAYDQLAGEYGLRVLGMDTDDNVVGALRGQGDTVMEADATDTDFWEKATLCGTLRMVVLAMPMAESNSFALRQLRAQGYTGPVAAIAQHTDEIEPLRDLGADAVFHLYKDTGTALADTAVEVAGGPETLEANR